MTGGGANPRARHAGGDTRIVYGVGCVWWDSIDKVHVKNYLPCCPHCGSVLMEVPSIDVWWRNVDDYEAKGNPGYRHFIEWLRGRCFRTIEEARAEYEGTGSA